MFVEENLEIDEDVQLKLLELGLEKFYSHLTIVQSKEFPDSVIIQDPLSEIEESFYTEKYEVGGRLLRQNIAHFITNWAINATLKAAISREKDLQEEQ